MNDNLDELKTYWNSFNAKHPDFDRTDKMANLLFYTDIKLNKDWELLDLGCGPGRLSMMCHNKIKKYYGVDISKNMIEEAKRTKTYTNAEFLVNDGKTLKEFEDNKFDIVISATVFQHVGKNIINSYMKEIYRVLKPSGFFLINFPKVSFYKAYGYTKEELDNLLIKFKCEEFYECPKKAHFYIRGVKNV